MTFKSLMLKQSKVAILIHVSPSATEDTVYSHLFNQSIIVFSFLGFVNDTDLIPKNTSVIVARVPASNANRKHL